MDPFSIWLLLSVINGLVYVAFVVRRGEAGFYWSALLAVVLGPLVWFVWAAQRAGRNRSEAR